jgi:hypothetical protein
MTTRPFHVLAAVACLAAAPAFADEAAEKAATPSVAAADACGRAEAQKRVHPHPHKGLIQKRSARPEGACVIAQRKLYDTSI